MQIGTENYLAYFIFAIEFTLAYSHPLILHFCLPGENYEIKRT